MEKNTKKGNQVEAPIEEELIRQKAQEIYENRVKNNIDGNEKDDWKKAEKELTEKSNKNNPTKIRKPADLKAIKNKKNADKTVISPDDKEKEEVKTSEQNKTINPENKKGVFAIEDLLKVGTEFKSKEGFIFVITKIIKPANEKEEGKVEAIGKDQNGKDTLFSFKANQLKKQLEDGYIEITKVSDIEEKEETEAEKKLRVIREEYLKEYKKCKNEMHRQLAIEKTSTKVFNALAGIKNIFSKKKIEKKVFKEEDFFTEKFKETKERYNQARIEMGNEMYATRKAELEKAGLSGEELELALTQYKATEILAKTIIDERQKIIDARGPEKTALWKKLVDGYMAIKPRWKRVALSTAIFLIPATVGVGVAIAGGAAGATALAGLGWLFTTRVAKSLAVGVAIGHLSKGVDWARKGSDSRFKESQEMKREELQSKFAKGEIDQIEYEKEIEIIEKEDKEKARNRTLLKMGVGIALAGTAGYLAYDAFGHGIASADSGIDAHTGADMSNHIPNIPVHGSVEAVADHGQGAISTLRELQHNLKIEYGGDLDNAPVGVKHILETDPHKLAMEYGMYKPGQVDESAFDLHSIKVDGEGHLTYQISGNHTDINTDNTYDGKMFDSDHSGVKVETPVQETPSGDYSTPEQVDPITGEPMNIDHVNTVPEQVDPITGNSIPANGIPTETAPLQGLSQDQLTEVGEVSKENINHLFPGKPELWDKISSRVSADRLLELGKGGVQPEYQPLVSYIDHLKETSGLEPIGPDLTHTAEPIPDYIHRALEKIEAAGKINEVKLSGGVLPIEHAPTITPDHITTPTIEPDHIVGHEATPEPVAPTENPVLHTEPVVTPEHVPTSGVSHEPISSNATPETIAGGEPISLTPDQTISSMMIINDNQLHIFGDNPLSSNLADRIGGEEVGKFIHSTVENSHWKDLYSGDRMGLDSFKEEALKNIHDNLSSYLHKLESVSGLHPQVGSTLESSETVSHFINRTVEEITRHGDLDKIKIK